MQGLSGRITMTSSSEEYISTCSLIADSGESGERILSECQEIACCNIKDQLVIQNSFREAQWMPAIAEKSESNHMKLLGTVICLCAA
jgi:hypothetical protein